MKKQNANQIDAARLRQKAEELLQRKDKAYLGSKPQTEPDMLKLIHELEVHQIELEMQNEELVKAKEKAELAEEKYAELYDFAPTGLLSITKEAEILELNFAAARMLGKERAKLMKKRFDIFLSQETLSVFNLFVQKVFTSKTKQSCEVIIVNEGNCALAGQVLPIYVNIDGVISQNDDFCLLTLTDVTERNRAIIELQRSEEKYRISEFLLKKAQRIAHLGNWELNIETNELFWSDEIYRIFECEPHEFDATYEAFIEFIHPDDREEVNAAYLKSLETKVDYQIEHRIITKNNKLKYVKEKCTTTFNEKGIPLRSFGIVIDITESKQIEAALKNSENLLKKIFEILPIGLWFADANGKLIRGNPAGVKIWGAEPTVAIEDYGVFKARFYPSGQKIEPNNWALAHTIRKGVTVEDELIEIDAFDGKKKIILNYTAPVLDDQGNIQGAIVVNQDITKRKQAEEKLKDNNLRLNLAMQSANMAWWEMDISSGMVVFEKRKAEMLGYAPEKFNHYSDFMALVHPEDNAKAMNAMRKHLDGSLEKYEVEYRILNNSGEYKWFYDIGSIVKKDSEGKPLKVTGLVIDISQRKQIEEAILAKMDELERFHKLTVGREIAMVELKKEVNNLLNKLGQGIKYKIVE